MTMDRRLHPRFQNDTLVTIEVLQDGQPAQSIFGKTVNISETGVLIQTATELQLAENAILSIATSEEITTVGSVIIRSAGTVITNEDGKEQTWWLYGMEFVEIRISEFRTLLKYLSELSSMRLKISG